MPDYFAIRDSVINDRRIVERKRSRNGKTEDSYNLLLKQELDGLFPGLLDITGEGTPGVTGYFEVGIENGKLLHSKKNGSGFVDTPAKMQAIVDGIKLALAE
ncbi:hypothetical protein DAPPUDRAFT_228129 [Daphnia pulex]|uniref:Selenoprotein W n=1 Tax=Daphnia pulex TaxID=6669 RepID=E9HBA7_DAPPU|nr:hypothetical protein DAPPUDRAFT_228129 [Daphnia pulex]|eukprot:EFX70938.1 hypothetical protein DAPPUDRAFT_228129 [Daphnia pulex]